jgi:hypothetical protein
MVQEEEWVCVEEETHCKDECCFYDENRNEHCIISRECGWMEENYDMRWDCGYYQIHKSAVCVVEALYECPCDFGCTAMWDEQEVNCKEGEIIKYRDAISKEECLFEYVCGHILENVTAYFPLGEWDYCLGDSLNPDKMCWLKGEQVELHSEVIPLAVEVCEQKLICGDREYEIEKMG